MEQWRHTTVVAVRRAGTVAIGSDGQVTLGSTVMKHGAAKVRRLAGGRVLAGFSGSVADALALFTRFEAKLEEFGHNLERAAVELAREWRTDRALRHLEKCGVAVREGESLFRAREVDSEMVDRLLDEALLEALDARGERPREMVQTALTLEQFGH